MHADRTNRVALIVFGLLVLVIGAGGLIASLGVFSKEFSHRTLIDNRASTYIGHNGAWIWPVAAGVCLVIGLLALRWIVALLVSTDRAGDLPIPVAEPRRHHHPAARRAHRRAHPGSRGLSRCRRRAEPAHRRPR